MTNEIIRQLIQERTDILEDVMRIQQKRQSQHRYHGDQLRTLKYIAEHYCPNVHPDPRSLAIALRQHIRSLYSQLEILEGEVVS
ncbi:hypothetical protein D1872_36450 [compost metagenome]